MVVFTSQITLTHAAHHAAPKESPRGRIHEAYRAAFAATARRPSTAGTIRRLGKANEPSPLNVLARPASARSTPRRSVQRANDPPVGSAVAAALAADIRPAADAAASSPRRPATARSHYRARVVDAADDPRYDSHTSSAATALASAAGSALVRHPKPPPLMRSTYSSLMAQTADEARAHGGPLSPTRMDREREQRRDRHDRLFNGTVFETTRSLTELERNAAAAATLPRPPQAPRSIPPYQHGPHAGEHGGDGTGAGGPFELLRSPPRPRPGPLDRLLMRSEAELELLRRMRSAQSSQQRSASRTPR